MNLFSITYQHTDSDGTTFERFNSMDDYKDKALSIFKSQLVTLLNDHYFNNAKVFEDEKGDIIAMSETGDVYEVYHSFNIRIKDTKPIYKKDLQ